MSSSDFEIRQKPIWISKSDDEVIRSQNLICPSLDFKTRMGLYQISKFDKDLYEFQNLMKD